MGLRQLKLISLTIAYNLLLTTNGTAQASFAEKHIEVGLRMIGHQVLLNSNDSTSRILPITKNNGQYRIRFESEFEFLPDELVNTIDHIMKSSLIAKDYIVEVEHCETGEVIYSFEMGNMKKKDIIPCQTRRLPKSCYSLLFTLSNIKAASASKVNSQTTGSQIDAKLLYYLAFFLILIIGIMVGFFLWKRRTKNSINPNLISLGKYHFDKQNATLILEEQLIDLTSKEADLLLLLYNAANQTVEREVILNVVWGDVGDYVGRTLDVFISKIRKKLEADPGVKIVNIRGVGYKLVF